MGEPSIFLTEPENATTSTSGRECIYRSESGPSVLYRVSREGKFRVFKALKEKYRDDPFYRGLLRKEFEIGWELDHPGICKTLDFREVEELGPCIEMEWVDGCTLEALYARGPVDRDLERQLFTELCDVLSYIHRKQVFHRDLKPENILVTHKGSHIKLIDFGLSDTDTHATHKESAGTVVYAAPEVLRGNPADARSDIYSLGRILFEVSDRYTGIALRCMEQRPEKRYASADEVREALLRHKSRKGLWWTLAALVLVASVLVGGWLFEHGGKFKRAEEPAAAPAPANPEEIDDIFEEVSRQILDAQER